MATSQLNQVMQRISRQALPLGGAGPADGQLLTFFIERRDERAFEALVSRHGPMVLGVCRRILVNPHDAEDAFQATFLVLVHKAASISPPEMVGNWLYGVACQTAVKARALAKRRAARERQMIEMPEPPARTQAVWDDLRPLLDSELSHLPDKYRAPIVLCDLEGKSGREAAQQLGCPEGTLTGRLSRARAMLAKRLKRRGLQTTGGSLALVLANNAASAAVPAALAVSTTQAATLFAVGQAGVANISASVIALTEGVLKAMLMTKLQSAGAMVLLAALVGLGGSALAQRDSERKPREAAPGAAAVAQRDGGRGPVRQDVHGVVKSVDATANTITIMAGGARDAAPAEKTYTLAKNAEIAIGSGGGRGGRGALAREGKLADLAAGSMVSLTLSADEKTVESIGAEGPMVRGIVKAVDGLKNTLTLTIPSRGGRGGEEVAAEEKTYNVDPNGEVGMDDGRGRRFSIKEAKLTDVATGSYVTLGLSVDQKHAVFVMAEGPMFNGVVKAVDAGKNTITITTSQGRGGEAEEKTLDVPKNAVVLLDDGRGRRLSIKEGKLADLPVGSMVNAKLSADQKAVGMIRAEGPSAGGRLKSIDSAKGAITIETFVARGENPEEKTFTFAKDVRVMVDGKEAKLTDIKVEDGTFAQVRLTLDQKTVQAIQVGRPRGRE